MKTLVTGASGMLGANLCSHLVKSGQAVKAFTRKPLQHPILNDLAIEQALGDLADLDSIDAALVGCEQVFHTAGLISYHPGRWSDLYRTNVIGTENILKAAAKAGVRRIVLTSSTAAIGIPELGQRPLDEAAVFGKEYETNPYMYSKKLAEEVALKFSGIEVIVVNPATIFGAGDVKMNTGVLFRKINEGRFLFCPPGATSVVSVQDCVAGHVLAMERGRPRNRYILSSSNHTYRELLGRIATISGAQAPKYTLPRGVSPCVYLMALLAEKVSGIFGSKSMTRHVVTLGFSNRFYSSHRARSELGWYPKQSIDEMLEEACDYYIKNNLI